MIYCIVDITSDLLTAEVPPRPRLKYQGPFQRLVTVQFQARNPKSWRDRGSSGYPREITGLTVTNPTNSSWNWFH
jgi:hypothetical protein